MTRTDRQRKRGGFSVVEVAIAVTLFSVLGLGLAMASRAGGGASATVALSTAENGDLRDVTRRLTGELTTASDAGIAVTVLPSLNHELTFSVPILDGGAPAWGVYDTSLGTDPAQQNRADWSFRYTVREVPAGGGAVDRQLVRQILDDADVVQRETVVLTGLRSGAVVPPGFTVVPTGDIWEITISTESDGGGSGGRRMVFHVNTRN